MNEALLTEVKHDNGQNCFRDSSSISTHLFTYVPFYLYAFVTVYLFTYVPFYLFNFVSMYLFIYVPFYPCTFLSMYLCTFLPMYFFIYLPLYLCTFLPIYLCTYVSFYLCTFLSMYLMFVYLSICSSVCAFIFCIVQRPFLSSLPILLCSDSISYLFISTEKLRPKQNGISVWGGRQSGKTQTLSLPMITCT